MSRFLRPLRSRALTVGRFFLPPRACAGALAAWVTLIGAACTPIELPPPADERTTSSDSSGENERPEEPLLPSFASALELGEEMPNLDLTTQLGQQLKLSDLAGTVVILSFFSCQHPEGSPGSDLARRLRELQDTLRPDLWEQVHIVTVSTEPLLDTPEVLLRCAQDLGAKLDRWTLATPASADFTAIAARLDVLIWAEEGDETAHTLSTLVIDQQGFLADRFRGLTQWSVGDLIAAVVQTAER